MHFAERADVTRRSDHHRGIVERVTGTLGDTSNDVDAVAACGVDPGGRRLAWHLLGERKSLVPIAKDVTRIGEFRENDQAGTLARRLLDPFQTVCEICLLGADDRLHLNAGNGDFALRSRHGRPFPKQKTSGLAVRGGQPESPQPDVTRPSGRRSHHRERYNSLGLGWKSQVRRRTQADQTLCFVAVSTASYRSLFRTMLAIRFQLVRAPPAQVHQASRAGSRCSRQSARSEGVWLALGHATADTPRLPRCS
jgi:hypothetical protein